MGERVKEYVREKEEGYINLIYDRARDRGGERKDKKERLL